MKQDGPLLKELQDALIHAYPTRQDLAMMVSYGLGENLGALVADGSLEHMVYELLQWAFAQGRHDELIRAALLHNRHNPHLLRVASLLGLLSDQQSVAGSPFLCAAPKDMPLLNRLKEDLCVQGILAENDSQASKQSSSLEHVDVRETMRLSSVMIVVASAQTRRSRRVKEALSVAQMYQRGVFLFWMQGDHLAEVVPTGWNHLPCIDARGERYEVALQELIQMLFKQEKKPASQTAPQLELETILPPPRNPYKGLQAFRMEDAADFFGRDRLIEELLEKMRAWCVNAQQGSSSARLLTVLGASGSGKSSVVMAGLLPKLKQGGLAGSQDWIYLDPMVPGKHPLEALAVALTPLFPERSPLAIMREDLEDDSARGLHVLLAAYVKQSGRSVVVVIDQFEELFTQTATEQERRQFLDVLLAALSEPNGPLIAVLTLRADFYDRLSQYPELGQLIGTQQVMMYLLETPDLRKVIEQPTRLPDVQLLFEEGLVGDLLFDVQGQVGTLPLLQFTLDQLFERREDRLLTLAAYHEIGGVKGALAQHAESTYQSLPTTHHQHLARALFLRLMNVGTVQEDATRRRVALSELVVVDAEETERLAQVTHVFTKARLLTANAVGGVSTVEVSHEALIQVWLRLQDWLHEARDQMRLQAAISEDAAEWNRYGRTSDRLYRGSQLMMALRWRKDNLPSLDEDSFLQASLKERQREGRRRIFIGFSAVAAMAGTDFLVMVLRGSVSASKGPLSLVQLPSIYKGDGTALVKSVAWSPDGQSLAFGSLEKTVQVWDTSNGKLLLTYKGHSDSVISVAWEPMGLSIASTSWDKTVQVWSVSGSKNSLLIYKGHADAVSSVAWEPSGGYIASGSLDKTVQVWHANSGRRLFTYKGHTDAVISVAWSPDGQSLASGSSDKTVHVWHARSGVLLLIYKGHADAISSVAWSPTGQSLASSSSDKTVHIWHASSGDLLLIYKGHADAISSVAWSPDGRRIASGSLDKTAQVWDASGGDLLLIYKGHADAVSSVAWSPTGLSIASSSRDDTVQIWDAKSTSNSLLTYKGHADAVWGVAWSPSGNLMVSSSSDMTVQIWEANSGRRLISYKGHADATSSVAWSPDGKRIASGSLDKTVQVWEANSGRRLITYRKHTDAISSVAWEPTGLSIASGSLDKTVQVWDASSGNGLFTYKGHADAISSVAWSPNGQYIASGSLDRTVQVWEASGRSSSLLTYKGHEGAVYSVAWSPTGQRIASGSRDDTVQIWDASSGDRLLTYKGHVLPIWSVAWSPTGQRIASASVDHTVQCYDGWAW